MAIVAENHPAAAHSIFTLDAMSKYPFIGNPESHAPSFYAKAREKWVQFNRIMTVSNDFGAFAMISENLGFGVFPKSMAEKSRFPVKALPMELDAWTIVSLGFKSCDNLSLAARAFIDYAAKFDYSMTE